MDPDLAPGPANYVIDLQDISKKLFFSMFFCLLLFNGTFTSFFKDKVIKKPENIRNKGFSYYFCLIIEGSGYRSLPVTTGSGSRSGGGHTDPDRRH
jgi:hypothetical protein